MTSLAEVLNLDRCSSAAADKHEVAAAPQGGLADQFHPVLRHHRQEPDGLSAGHIEKAAELAGHADPLQLGQFDPRVPGQDLNPRADGRLGPLQVIHILQAQAKGHGSRSDSPPGSPGPAENRPVRDNRPISRRRAMRSTNPEPQKPRGSSPPIT